MTTFQKGLFYKTRRFFKKKIGIRGHHILISIPFIWFIIFLMIPFLLLLKISLSDPRFGLPPYDSILTWVNEGYLQLKLNISNYFFILKDKLYIYTYLHSLWIAFISTLVSLIIGYPFAFAIFRATPRWRTILIMLVVLPFWTSFLIRVYAWISLLSPNGIINNFLMFLGVIQEPLKLIGNDAAVCLGIVYCYLPFMVLPIYFALQKMDLILLEAAYDLGCTPFKAFWSIVIPLTFKGIMAGSILIFVPALGEFVIPELLGGADSLMIGRILWNEFFNNRDWPVAAALAIIMLVVLIFPIMFIQRLWEKEE